MPTVPLNMEQIDVSYRFVVFIFFPFIVELFLFKMIARNTIQELNLLIQDRELNILSDIFGSIRKIGCKLKNIGANLKVQMSKLLKT